MDLWHRYPIITNQYLLLWCEDGTHYPSSASLIAGSRTSRSVSLPLPKAWTVSAHAAAAPTQMCRFQPVDSWMPPAWNSYTIEISKWDLHPFKTTLADMFYVQLLWWAARTVQCFDFLGLGIIVQAKSVPVDESIYFLKGGKRHKPSDPTTTRFCDIQCCRRSHCCISCEYLDHVACQFVVQVTTLISSIPALPPFLKISNPASVAKGWEDETTPFVPYTTDLRLGNRWNESSGWLILSQSILMLDTIPSEKEFN